MGRCVLLKKGENVYLFTQKIRKKEYRKRDSDRIRRDEKMEKSEYLKDVEKNFR